MELVVAQATLGHARLTYFSGPEASWADGMRWRAVSEACHELGLQVRRIGPIVPSVQGGFAAARAWLEGEGIATSLELGAAMEPGEGFAAHAWLRAGGEIVTGGDVSGYAAFSAGRQG